MEQLRGKQSLALERAMLLALTAGYRDIVIDIGTGDGRFVQRLARAEPATFVIGLDLCRENLRVASRTAPPNALFVIADGLALPAELAGLATRLTINFPWGSLLRGLLTADAALTHGLRVLAPPGATLDLRLNDSALAQAGWVLAAGGVRAGQTLCAAGFAVDAPHVLDAAALRACPTSWARRLAHGRQGYALHLRAYRRRARRMDAAD
ncbi:MAG: class I SAM-dependent methyltransferase [Thermomicrobiales bacterium]